MVFFTGWFMGFIMVEIASGFRPRKNPVMYLHIIKLKDFIVIE